MGLLYVGGLFVNAAQNYRFAGWVTMVEAWITCIVPAYLLLTGMLS
ncbi:MAG: AmiS/UreI family transporter [Rubrobacteraceae bacterium]|nr:AmiS/UreI family transporter [Rubrobacteraceae bacterium]